MPYPSFKILKQTLSLHEKEGKIFVMLFDYSSALMYISALNGQGQMDWIQ